MNYFSSSKGGQAPAETLLGCMSMRMESLLRLLAVVLAVSLSDLVSGCYDVHRHSTCNILSSNDRLVIIYQQLQSLLCTWFER